jgi:uncharacterized membrane protein
MFDQINQHQEKLFNLSKIILIIVALIMSFTIIYFMFFYKRIDALNPAPSTVNIEKAEIVIEP